MRAAPWLLTLLLLAGCASSEEEGRPVAREVSWRAEPGEEAARPPEAAPVKPREVRTQPAAPRQPWKGERVRALGVDHEAAARVDAALAKLEGDPAARRAADRRARSRDAADAASARARAQGSLERLEAAEAERSAELLREARARRTDHHAEVRVRVFLGLARERAGTSHGAALLREARALAEQAARRARACRELMAEAEAELGRARRFAQAALEHGVPSLEARRDLIQALRRRSGILVIADEAEAEAGYAREAAERASDAYNPLAGVK
ncbi:MAG: hypothetical protein AB7N76_24990 [Planctomycetota bacterium]